MMMLEECIDKIEHKTQLSQVLYPALTIEGEEQAKELEEERELLKSLYYHLLDYKDVLNKSIELTNEIAEISHCWELVKKANKE